MLHVLGRLEGCPERTIFEALNTRLLATMDTLSHSREVSNVVWALARLARDPADSELLAPFVPALLESAGKQAMMCKDWIPHGVSNMLWAHTMLGVKPGNELLIFFEACVGAHNWQLNHHEFLNIFFAYATFDLQLCEGLLGEVRNSQDHAIKIVSPQGVKKLLFSHAKVYSVNDDRYFDFVFFVPGLPRLHVDHDQVYSQ